MESLPRSPAFLLIVIAFILGEWVWRTRIARRSYDLGGAAGSAGVAIGQLIINPMTGALIAAVMVAIEAARPWVFRIDDWRTWAIGFFAVEFVYYWFHRWSHEVRWLWATHAVHHSANEMTFPAAIRLGWTGAFSGGWILFAGLVAIGFPALMVAILLAANLTYQFFLHTEAVGRLGPLEWVLNTPAHHRVHHAANATYLDKNYGGVLIVFDRLFGTFAAETVREPIRYGLVRPLKSNNPFVIALHEWRNLFNDVARARSLRALGSALFGRPR